MTSYEFMQQCVRGNQTRSKTVASVYFDGQHVYSYGRHYPLLINIAGKWIINDRGYSSTTGKHISWARSLADFVMSIPNHQSSDNVDPEKLLEFVNQEIEEKNEELRNTPKRAFRKIENLQKRNEELARTERYLMQVVEGYQTT